MYGKFGKPSSHLQPTHDLGVSSLKPKLLTDSECSKSIQGMEKILLQRLLIRKELKIQSMLARLEEQEQIIESLKGRLKKAESNQTTVLVTSALETVAEALKHCFGFIWGLLCGLAFYSSQVY